MTNTWRLFLSSGEAWESMYRDIEQARISIDVEQFIFDANEQSRRFFTLFIAKAKSGVRVRMICDMVGSYDLYESSLVSELRDAGIELIFFNPISAWRLTNFTSWFFRDHRKVLIIDGEIVHTGGVGFNEKSIDWRDTNIRITGPVVEPVRYSFEQMWNGSRTGKFLKSRRPEVLAHFAWVTNAPYIRQRHYYRWLHRKIRKAQRRILLATPYFIPPVRLFRTLRRAARRGVDVRLLVPMASDSGFVDLACQSFFGMALAAGIKLYRFQGTVLHAKVTVIDDAWASIGSMNLDNVSIVHSYEANIVSDSPDFIKSLRDQFMIDLEHAQELTLVDWKKRSSLRKFFEMLTWPTHGFL